ncbi:hypothetical protein [Paenibacillus tianjinensis]|uniref:Uncharacterized protein n=1 Tax=Paenibacillus tianjinensis TaxID=2810347 RepID=A0ABX7L9I6_9BACL|nr:hypothetical protein [Paenibacillus tianjinensis]QSF43379.1 hypothetical protein JRJ22_19120 [Paenibacillus tianjinensis]
MEAGILFTVELATLRDSQVLCDGLIFNTYVDANDCAGISSDSEEIDIEQMEEMAIKYAIEKLFDQGYLLRVGEMIEVVSVSH